MSAQLQTTPIASLNRSLGAKAKQKTMNAANTENKSPTAFRTISEVATELAVPQHVLRFWESKFPQVRPLKRGGGRRYYRPEDIHLLKQIQTLLYNQGYTIRGVQKVLKDNRGVVPIQRVSQPDPVEKIGTLGLPMPPRPALSHEKRREIEGILQELKSLRELMRQAGF